MNHKILSNDIIWMIGFAAILIPFILLPKKLEIGRLKGFILVASYLAFVFLALKGDN